MVSAGRRGALTRPRAPAGKARPGLLRHRVAGQGIAVSRPFFRMRIPVLAPRAAGSKSEADQSSLEEGWQSRPVFCLENPVDRGTWRAAVRGITRSRARLRDSDAHSQASQAPGFPPSSVCVHVPRSRCSLGSLCGLCLPPWEVCVGP